SAMMPNVRGVDDYLHQAADSSNWPEGIIYDPDNSGKPMPSLGVHEHWNNPENKQYSKNLGKSYGIELVSIPEDLIGPEAPKLYAGISADKIVELADYDITLNLADTDDNNTQGSATTVINTNSGNLISSVDVRPLDDFDGKKFLAVVDDGNNRKIFLTDAGLASGGFRGFNRYATNDKIPENGLTDIKFEINQNGPTIWLASQEGAFLTSLPLSANSSVINYNTKNSEILSDTVSSIAIGRDNVRWFGTPKGVSALYDEKWLTPDYEADYPQVLFELFPITTITASILGDTLYVATEGAGVARLYKNDVDAISSASPYANWETIRLPSDNIYSICLSTDGSKWFGTDKGIARHTGSVTIEGWDVYTVEDGLVNNFVRTIEEDLEGNMWFGTKGGISVYNGSEWFALTVEDGLISNNILDILADKMGSIYLCTDKGIMVYQMGGSLTVYK
ncbi:MAG TPA: two-component regulator propeller domain-containing protein, partial [Draconibacterium sp.]|nr:two-component regulator propeller domain-containing protein [Draconibacterium sp.]